MNSKLLKYGCLIILCLSLAACVAPTVSPTAAPTVAPQPTATSASEAPIKIGFSAWPGWFPWQVAAEKGLFEKHNVKVEMVWFEGYLDSLNAFAAGQLDGNAQTLNDTISSVAAGSDQVIVLVNDNSTGNDQIIVKPEIEKVEDLKGKKIAAELGTVDHFLLLLGMEKVGLSHKDIDFQPLETGAAAAAFAAGQLDGVGVFAPFTTQALSTGQGKVLFTSKDFPGAIPDHLVLSREFVSRHPDQVQAIVDTWFETLDYIKTNPDETYTIMAQRAGVSVEDYKTYDGGTTLFSVSDNLNAFIPGDDMTHLPYAAEEIAKFLVENDLAQKKPDLTKLLDDQFVKAYAAAHP